jgi:hypothetical protein
MQNNKKSTETKQMPKTKIKILKMVKNIFIFLLLLGKFPPQQNATWK